MQRVEVQGGGNITLSVNSDSTKYENKNNSSYRKRRNTYFYIKNWYYHRI